MPPPRRKDRRILRRFDSRLATGSALFAGSGSPGLQRLRSRRWPDWHPIDRLRFDSGGGCTELVEKLDQIGADMLDMLSRVTITDGRLRARTRLRRRRSEGHSEPRSNLRALARSLREIFTAAHDIAAAVDTHNVALTTMRSDMNTQFAMVVVVTAIQIGHSMVRVEEPQAKQKTPHEKKTSNDRREEIDFLDQAAGALAGPANTFLAKLGGFTFSVPVLTTGGLLSIVELPILLTTASPTEDVTFTDPRRPHLGSDGKYHVQDGDREVQIDNPNDTSKTITDIDEVKNGVLWEEKSATNAADVEKWVAKQVEKKLGSYIEARQYIDGYEQAPIGLRFTTRGVDPGFRAQVEAAVEKMRADNPGVQILVEWA